MKNRYLGFLFIGMPILGVIFFAVLNIGFIGTVIVCFVLFIIVSSVIIGTNYLDKDD